jgi:hypothetical protein
MDWSVRHETGGSSTTATFSTEAEAFNFATELIKAQGSVIIIGPEGRQFKRTEIVDMAKWPYKFRS